MAGRLPATRVMDGIKIGVDLPQEEEFALLAMGAPSCYDLFYFPDLGKSHFHKFMDLSAASPSTVSRWKRCYHACQRNSKLSPFIPS